jgi:hypothetical protein
MSDEQRPLLFDREALIVALRDDERLQAMAAAVAEAEEAWTQRIAAEMLHSKKPVDQRKVDFMRGYFAGARYYTGGRVDTAEQRMLLQSVHENEEAEA